MRHVAVGLRAWRSNPRLPSLSFLNAFAVFLLAHAAAAAPAPPLSPRAGLASATTPSLAAPTSPTLSAADKVSTIAAIAEEESPVPHWKRLEPGRRPTPRFRALMIYAPDRQRTLLFGGFLENRRYCNETWEYDGRIWKQLDVVAPHADSGYVLAYDNFRGVALLYGGRARETWEFDGKSWERVRCENRPPITGFGAMAYDTTRRAIVLFGGEGVSAENEVLPGLCGETWQYDGYDWLKVAGEGPSPRKYHKMVYDSYRKRFVMFGGFGGTPRNDTWELTDDGWHRVSTTKAPSARRGFALTYDPVGRQTLLFGGYPGGDELWAFDGEDWSRIMATRAPPFREGAGLVYLPTTKRVLLFAGLSSRLLDDSWELIRAAAAPPLQLPPAPPPEVADSNASTASLPPIPIDLPIPPVKRPPPAIVEADLPPSTAPIVSVVEKAPKSPKGPKSKALADLHFENAELAPRFIVPGRSVYFSGFLRNSGSADGQCWVEFWLSGTREPFERQRMLCESIKVNLGPGESYDLSQLVRTAADDLPQGTFFVGFEADRLREAEESNEKNNLFVPTTSYTIAPKR